ncbi:hypothetical protein PGT21_010372 [Puccinia graminis f. sp. tritici]|uniref:Uncharacterized protein n=1 Tax=Puccinia graminis f. sp. tritici TaxID=56615 RepID=A0A5B0PDY4_PUCGR|nr:hypothetical protein PGT21_010372 [Puccinia graminis f. sp. tritici]
MEADLDLLDLLEKQKLASPREGNLVSSNEYLSSISSDPESDPDLLDKQTLAPIRDGDPISSTEWTPIATSNTPRNRTQKRKTLPSEAEPTRFPEWTPNAPCYLSKQQNHKKQTLATLHNGKSSDDYFSPPKLPKSISHLECRGLYNSTVT